MNAYTLAHVLLSLVAILSGLVVLRGLLAARLLPRWTPLFVWTTVATTLTGFGFPFNGFTPAIGTGIVSSVVLVFLLIALHAKKLAGAWRKVYVITAIVSVYLNVFVLIVQSFQKIAFFKALAPTQSEPPFQIAQGAALVLMIVLAVLAVRKFRPIAA